MLRAFQERRHVAATPRLVQASGESLPFPDGAFDVVMMIQVFGGLPGWRRIIDEAGACCKPAARWCSAGRGLRLTASMRG